MLIKVASSQNPAHTVESEFLWGSRADDNCDKARRGKSEPVGHHLENGVVGILFRNLLLVPAVRVLFTGLLTPFNQRKKNLNSFSS